MAKPFLRLFCPLRQRSFKDVSDRYIITIFKFAFDNCVTQSTCFIIPLTMWYDAVIVFKSLVYFCLIKTQRHACHSMLISLSPTNSFSPVSKVGQPVVQDLGRKTQKFQKLEGNLMEKERGH